MSPVFPNQRAAWPALAPDPAVPLLAVTQRLRARCWPAACSRSATTPSPCWDWRALPCRSCSWLPRRHPPTGGSGGPGLAADAPGGTRTGFGQRPRRQRRARRRGPRHRRRPQPPDPAAGRRGAVDLAPLQGGAGTHQRAGAGSLGAGPSRQARPHPDPGRDGHRIALQPVCPKPRGRAGPDAGDDAHPRRQVRVFRRQPRRLRPHQQSAGGRAGA